jgi:CBS domain containing-hemolysin-like protein
LIELHEVEADGKNRNEALSKEEIKMITNTIDLRSLNVKTLMIKKLYMLSNREKISNKLIRQIASRGFSKIPIYHKNDENHITGFLITKELLLHEKMVN